ncbi:MAG: hypothetical protein GF309_12740 [Candidatus Lokiarchaeota archaeon]|nr:hypothetical protein [Candidatus Lokiarchaeota archaeon]
MTDELNDSLQDIRSITGVENVVLIQKDGLPVASAGIWFSKDEVFAVASAACGIFGVVKLVHRDFKYLLMESDTSKVFLAALPRTPNYFLTITTAPRVNLAALFIEMRSTLSRISYLLNEQMSGSLPPLRSFSSEETKHVLRGFSVAEGRKDTQQISREVISLTRRQTSELRAILAQVHDNISDVQSTFLALSGGVRISLDGFTSDRLAAMSFALHDTSEQVIRTLRNSKLHTVLCETNNRRHFIYDVPHGVFSLWVSKESQKLGLMRLLLKHYIAELRRALKSASVSSPSLPDDLRDLLFSKRPDSELTVARRD